MGRKKLMKNIAKQRTKTRRKNRKENAKRTGLLSTGDVMEKLNISKRQVYLLMDNGVLTAINVGAGSERPRYRFHINEVEELINERIVVPNKGK